MNDKNNMIKLITFKNKSCTTDQGCDNLYDRSVYVKDIVIYLE